VHQRDQPEQSFLKVVWYKAFAFTFTDSKAVAYTVYIIEGGSARESAEALVLRAGTSMQTNGVPVCSKQAINHW
jgi:hypothetical protein